MFFLLVNNGGAFRAFLSNLLVFESLVTIHGDFHEAVFLIYVVSTDFTCRRLPLEAVTFPKLLAACEARIAVESRLFRLLQRDAQ